MKDCNYPDCLNCTKDDCTMGQNDIQALLKRRRYNNNPQKHREKQNDYRKQKRKQLPNCNECENCVLVKKEKQDGCRRLCIDKMRLIEQKVSNSPQWCSKREPSKDYLKRRENILKQKKEKYNKAKVI